MQLPSLSWYAPPVVAGLVPILLASACKDSPDQGSSFPADQADPANDIDGPVGLGYLCGNRFLLTNAGSAAVTVRWRIIEANEEGTETLPAGTSEHHPEASEREFETQSRGTVELYLGARRIGIENNSGTPCTPFSLAASTASADPRSAGAWSAVFGWPIVAVHANLLPNGKVLAWGRYGPPQVWDPATGGFQAYPSPALLFCAGHAFAADGRLVVIGGHIIGGRGLPNVTLFDARTGWSSQPPMSRGRWYPTVTTTAKGEVAILAGSDKAAQHVAIPEIWRPTGRYSLTTASRVLPWYPMAFLAPSGKLFVAGEEQMSRYLDVTGTGRWTDAGLRQFGVRDQGSAVMYDAGRILYTGGGRTTNSAEVIDLRQAQPTWQTIAPMAYARRHLNTTVLPSGEVLVTGGTAGTAQNDLTAIVRAAEMWNPATRRWTTMASSNVERSYHSTSLLLPNGRVLHAGSGDAPPAPDQRSGELYSPPYLFRGTRPVIRTAPLVVAYHTPFRVTTPDAANITQVSLIRTGSVTHGFDMNQRFQRLSFTRDATGLNLAAFTSRNRTPPGHYLLFILNRSGVPSVAKIIQVK